MVVLMSRSALVNCDIDNSSSFKFTNAARIIKFRCYTRMYPRSKKTRLKWILARALSNLIKYKWSWLFSAIWHSDQCFHSSVMFPLPKFYILSSLGLYGLSIFNLSFVMRLLRNFPQFKIILCPSYRNNNFGRFSAEILCNFKSFFLKQTLWDGIVRNGYLFYGERKDLAQHFFSKLCICHCSDILSCQSNLKNKIVCI